MRVYIITYIYIYTCMYVCMLSSAILCLAVQDFADHEVCLADCRNAGDYATWRQVYMCFTCTLNLLKLQFCKAYAEMV